VVKVFIENSQATVIVDRLIGLRVLASELFWSGQYSSEHREDKMALIQSNLSYLPAAFQSLPRKILHRSRQSPVYYQTALAQHCCWEVGKKSKCSCTEAIDIKVLEIMGERYWLKSNSIPMRYDSSLWRANNGSPLDLDMMNT
jgi:hypothetical protein